MFFSKLLFNFKQFYLAFRIVESNLIFNFWGHKRPPADLTPKCTKTIHIPAGRQIETIYDCISTLY